MYFFFFVIYEEVSYEQEGSFKDVASFFTAIGVLLCLITDIDIRLLKFVF